MILYRTAGPWGAGTGANLSAYQVDSNFYDLASRVQGMELNAPQPVQITSFNSAGNQLYIYMSDGSVHGPLTLPVSRWRFRGAWTPSTIYPRDDVVNAPDGAVYIVTFTHTSGTSFDPGASDGQGNNFYGLLLSVPSAMLPAGGARGYVLTKSTFNSYDVMWAPVPSPPGGSAGEFLRKFSDFDGDAGWEFVRLSELHDVLLSTGAGGTPFLTHGDYLRYDNTVGRWVNHPGTFLLVLRENSWSPVLGDNSAFMVLTNGAVDTTIMIPHNDVQPFPVGTELHIHQDGTGKVTVVGDEDVTILKHASFSNELLGQYATASVKKTAANEWRLFGLLAGA